MISNDTLAFWTAVGICLAISSAVTLGWWIYAQWSPTATKDPDFQSQFFQERPQMVTVQLCLDCLGFLFGIFLLCTILQYDDWKNIRSELWFPVWFFSFLLVSKLFCRSQGHPQGICSWNSFKNPYSWMALTMMHFWLLGVALSAYGIQTLRGDNWVVAHEAYIGPARIVGFHVYDEVSTLTVAYGSDWACPGHPNLLCEKKALLFSDCDEYEPYMENVTCAAGLNGIDDSSNDDDEMDDDTIAKENRNWDPYVAPDESEAEWPYMVNIIGDCNRGCSFVTIDMPSTRDYYMRVERWKRLMWYGGLGGPFCLVMFLFIVRNNGWKLESPSNDPADQKDVELLPAEEGIQA